MADAQDPQRIPLVRRVGRVAWLVAINVLVVVLLLALVEGLASLAIVARALYVSVMYPVGERRHTAFDPELGWINLPNLAIPDMYGPGRPLHTNSRRFRGEREVAPEVPPGKRRIICSGDSFTQGYGVGDAWTWCERLAVIDDRLEAVNMGMSGYGLDQTYLWYRRGAAPLRHQVNILALVTSDFDRMHSDTYSGFPKPRLTLEGGTLTAANVPLSAPSLLGPWLAVQGPIVARLRVFSLSRRVMRSVGREVATPLPADEALRPIVSAVLADLKRLNDEQSSKLVVLYLPTDLEGERTRAWEAFIESEALALDVPFIDLVAELRKLPSSETPRLFNQNMWNHHLNDAGNVWVADLVYRRLMAEPEIAAALGGSRPAR